MNEMTKNMNETTKNMNDMNDMNVKNTVSALHATPGTNKQWTANWIWNDESVSPRNEWHCFRKSFRIDESEVSSGELSITADSRYVLYVNGTQVGRGPVRSWSFAQAYDTYDVKHLLRPNEENVIAVLVLHFGVSTFYYTRGRGGLLLELQYNDTTIATDQTWKTYRYLGQNSRAQRMSCQQGFSEYIDRRAWNTQWYMPSSSDQGWQQAKVIGAVGMEPWTTVIPRDIPMLTEETVYPVRVKSLAKVKSFSLTTAIDVRNVMVSGSENHANSATQIGYVATMIHASQAAAATLGFLSSGECMKAFSFNGARIPEAEIYGEKPERYFDVQLKQGNNLLIIDVSGRIHTGKLQFGVKTAEDVKLSWADLYGAAVHSDAEAAGQSQATYPFYRIGPFDTNVIIDHQPETALNWNNPEYTELLDRIKTVEDLIYYDEMIVPISDEYIAEVDVFSLCVYRSEQASYAVPQQLQQAIIANDSAGIVPSFKDGYDSEIVIDFGKEYSGYLLFEIDAAEGTILDWYGYEYENEHGSYRQHTYGLDHTIRYVSQEGRQFYESPIRRGFRYMALNVRQASRPVKIYGVKLIQSNYPVAEVGQFTSSDALLNEIWNISRHTTKLCMEDTFVDCPAYEQAFWVGDSRNEALVSNYIYGVDEIIERCLRLVPGSKDQSPLYVNQVPSGWNSVIPNWTFFWAIACYEHYEKTNNADFARDMYGHMKFTLEHYLTYINEQGLLDMKAWNLLDWSPIDQPHNGVVTHQNMFLVRALELTAKMGEQLQLPQHEELYAAAQSLRQAIQSQLWDEQDGAFIDCIHSDGRRSTVRSIQTQVVAYLTDVATQEQRLSIKHHIVHPPESFVKIGSPFMSFFYYEALSDMKHAQHMLDDIREKYGNMVEHGATTCWEQYPNFQENRANPDMLTRSHCHAWSAAPAYFLGREVLGIKALTQGWSKVEIHPQPADLKWAKGSVPHPDGGRIDVSWRIQGDSMHVHVVHPAHVEIDLAVPQQYKLVARVSTVEALNEA